VGCRDLTGMVGVRDVMGELSDLAVACLRVTLEFHWARLTGRHGLPPGAGGGMGFAVFALGKLAGGELNFSSDIDLMFLRVAEQGRTEGGSEPVSATRFYEKLATSLTQSLSEVTEDGFVFRVDLRLRPEGEKGELVPSLANALHYYLEWGRTWERAALMKAVPVAGDLNLGQVFLREVEPFIFRKHLDYSTIEEMRDMKLKIQAQIRRKPGVNIKLGQGGIREIEFFVQALQLINGGKTPAVRTPSTLEAIDRLEKASLLESGTAEVLRDAYSFFRTTEHRIQINHQRQTHELPRTHDDQEELARRMGYDPGGLAEFMADLDRRRRQVEELFAGMFYSSSDENPMEYTEDVQRIIDAVHDEGETAALLQEAHFQRPAESARLLKSLLMPHERRFFSEAGRRQLERLAPLFLEELLKLPEPDNALNALDTYISSLHASSSYFSTLLQNPPTARFLVRVLGESRFFADLLTHHPQAIDSLIGRSSAQRPQEKEALLAEAKTRLAQRDNYADALDALRVYKNEQILRIGVSHLRGEIDSPTARWLVTELADVCLEMAVKTAVEEMRRKFGDHGFGDAVPFVILGMGKLGGCEMSYLSDVDVIFIYDPPEGAVGQLSAHDWFSRLATRIISVLSARTAEGVVFAIDTRLRPSGNQGPLCTSLEAFRDYHQSTSQIWEKQALIKARPVTGPERLQNEVTAIARECVLRTRFTDDNMETIRHLRQRMEDELAGEDQDHVDLKTGRGGLIDVEFIVQTQILRYAKDYPQALAANTLEALAALHQCGILDAEMFHTLDSGYRFLTNLEDRLRIMEHRSIDRLPLEGAKLRGLARRMGYASGEQKRFRDEYFRVTQGIRAAYESLLPEKGGSPDDHG
jgi:glutamate-ammonia-ligase adenylyltransferase